MSLKRNVEEQNQHTFEAMLATAQRFRNAGLAPAVEEFFTSRGIDAAVSAIVSSQVESYMLGYPHGFAGMLVTPAGKFYEFELELNAAQTQVMQTHRFADVTSTQNTATHNRGIGKGIGPLSLAVLRSLNAD